MRSCLFLLLALLCVTCHKPPKKAPTKGKPQAKTQKQTPPPNKTVPESTKTKAEKQPVPLADSLDLKIGQMVLIGINTATSLSASDSILKEIKANKVGGIVLFEKNLAPSNPKDQFKKLIGTLQKQAAIPLFITIDEEGGKVHRLKEKYGFVAMPSAAYLGKLNDLDSTYYYNNRLASLMADLGINLNFAPSVDLALNKNNPVIAKIERSFSADPTITTKHALSCLQAHHDNDVKTILKHFPGHGSSSSDTHKGMVDVTERWKASELVPYKNIIQSGKIDAIMTAHIINCRLDTSCLPATLSKTIITGLLRDSLNFRGVVCSDDMQMYAISKFYGTEKAVKMCINAGVDLLLFGNNVNPQDVITASQVHAIIKKLVLKGDVSRARIDQSFKRIMALKEKRY